MKTISNGYIENIKGFGRELDSIITYEIDGQEIELGVEDLASVSPHYESDILKSIMKQLDVESNVEIPEGTEINYRFGVKVGNSYEYINYGDYIVYKVEKKEDTNSYQITCYDKMLYAMKEYEDLGITYPITIRNYINALCQKIGLTFKNASEEFANYDKEIQNELFLNTDGDTIGYTYRDVLDELAQVTGSMICINENNQLEIRYITEGYKQSKNILNVDQGYDKGYISASNVYVADTKNCLFKQHIEVESGKTYCFSIKQNVDNIVLSYYDSDDTYRGRQKVSGTNKAVYTVPNNVSYVRFAFNYDNSTTITDDIVYNLEAMVEEGDTRTSYEPMITGKNLLNTKKYELAFYRNNEYVEESHNALFTEKIEVDPTKYYCLSANTTVGALGFYWFNANDELIDSYAQGSTRQLVQQPVTNTKYARIRFVKSYQQDITQEIINDCQLMVEEGQSRTQYEPYQDLGYVVDKRQLKDINVNFGKKYGPINSIVLSRGEADNVYIQDEDSIEENGLCEIKIVDNQILKGNDRDEYLPDLFEKLDGLEYHLNDYSSTGITVLDPGDRYTVEIDDNIYSCVMFNDETNITQGLEENVHTDLPEESETDYTKADKTDRKLNQTIFVVDKHEQEIQSLISKVQDLSKTVEGIGQVQLEDAYEGRLHRLEIRGNVSLVYPNNQNRYGAPIIICDELVANNDTYVSEGIPYLNRNILYPSSTLYPKNSYLLVDDTMYKLDFEYLNYMNETVYDKYVYEEGKQWIERNVGFDANGDMYQLVNTYKEIKPDIDIEIKSNSLITLLSHSSAILKAEYLIENQYTEIFATQAYVNSEIKQTADAIELQVDAKVNEDEIVAKLNLGIQDGQGIVELKGNTVIIESDNFQLDAEGNVTCQDAVMDDAVMNTATINNATIYNTQIRKGDIKLESFQGHWESGQWVVPPGIILYDRDDPNNNYFELFHGSAYIKNNDEHCTYTYDGLTASTGSGNYWTDVRLNLANGLLIEKQDGSTYYQSYIKHNEGRVNGSMSATSFVNISEEKKKKNIEKFDKGLDIIKDIDIYTYNYKEETKKSNKKHYGVVIGDDYNYSQEITDNKNEGIDLYSFISVCCASIKEQQEQIEELQKEIKSLKEEKDGKDKLSK